MTTTTVSAPGKVLLAGGYLILEYPNIGLVLSTDKRFYCSVSSSARNNSEQGPTIIVVRSPQFHSTWTYTCQIDITTTNSAPLLELKASSANESENGFVEKTLRVVLAFLWQQSSCRQQQLLFPAKMDITIRADNDFYSVIPHLEERQWKATPKNVRRLPKFLKCPIDQEGKPIVNKTGLGSSAALVTSLVGALLQSFGVADFRSNNSSSNSSIQMAHNLAQICHCHAQGKVGSGFDVSSAVHGSHTYQRFPKCTLPDLLNRLEQPLLCKDTAELLTRSCLQQWKGGVGTTIQMPKGLQLLLADVCGGSESPSMARKVLSWKQQQHHHKQQQQQTEQKKDGDEQASSSFWENLSSINTTIAALFQQLSDVNNLMSHASTLSKLPAEQWESSLSSERDVVSILLRLRTALLEARYNLKAMGNAAGVPIEPNVQTELADATMKLPGVLAAAVPGAGGYDALACLYIDDDSVRDGIGELWSNWSSTHNMKVSSLSVRCPAGDGGGTDGLLFSNLEEEEELQGCNVKK